MARLDQLLSSLGYCSRREARAWIDEGRVTVNGSPADDFGKRVSPAEVQVDGEPLDHPEGILLLLNKPTGVVCSHDREEGPSIYDLFPARWKNRNPVVTSIGRLDKETSGLLLVTDQSPLVHKLTSPKHKVAKLYVATLNAEVSPERLAGLQATFASGTLMLEGEKEPCAPAKLGQRAPDILELELTEGRYHQVRRMFASQGYTVTALHRERFGELSLGDLQPGKWRELPLSTFG